MSPTKFTIPGFYVRQLIDHSQKFGVSVDRLIIQPGLGAGNPDDAWITLGLAEFRQFVVNAIKQSSEPAFGLLFGARLPANSHGMLGYTAMSAPTIRHVVELVERFMGIRLSLIVVSLRVENGEMQVRLAETVALGDIRRPVLEAIMIAIKSVLDVITQGSCLHYRVVFPFEAGTTANLARELFRCDLAYGMSWAGFAFPLDMVDRPLQMSDPIAFQEAALMCEQEFDKLHGPGTMAARVRKLLLEKQGNLPSLCLTSRLFNMASRTLHRRLEEEGTSFRKILDEVRHALAVKHLRAGRLTLKEAAYALGYTDVANFRRAFKRWERVSPSEFLGNDAALVTDKTSTDSDKAHTSAAV